MRSIEQIEVRKLTPDQVKPSRSGVQITFYEILTKEEFDEFISEHNGFRCYTLPKMPLGGKGSLEYHAKSNEILFVQNGGMKWYLEDIDGKTRTLELTDGDLVFYVPALTLHQHECTVEGTSIWVQRTSKDFDAYYEPDFRELQKLHCEQK